MSYPCTYCDPNFRSKLPFREECKIAKFVVVGTMKNPRIESNQKGATDFIIESILQNHVILNNKTQLVIPRYIPCDEKKPIKFLLFADVQMGSIDVYRGVPCKDEKIVAYIQNGLKLNNSSAQDRLLYYVQFLDHPSPEIAADAFLEFARANDQDIIAAGKKLPTEKFRKWLNDSSTPIERLNLYAFILGLCGNKEDETALEQMLQKNSNRTSAALSGILSSMVALNPEKGWQIIKKIISTPSISFIDRLSAVNTVRFEQNTNPQKYQKIIDDIYTSIIVDKELADMAIEDMRRLKRWDYTNLILEQYSKKSHQAPIIQRSIIRFALLSQTENATRFCEALKKNQPELYQEVLESVQWEQKNRASK